MKDNGARAKIERAEDFIKKIGHVEIWREWREQFGGRRLENWEMAAVREPRTVERMDVFRGKCSNQCRC